MNKIDLTKEHNELVRELENEIHSLGLLAMSRAGVFSKGFRPDIVTNVGGCYDDWVIIDVINTSSSLRRDISGLLFTKANAEKKGYSIRGILGVCSDRIKTAKNYIALIEQYPNFILIRRSDFKDTLKMWMIESAKGKLDKLGYITSYILKKPETQKKE